MLPKLGMRSDSRKREFALKGDYSDQIAPEVLWVVRNLKVSPRGTPALAMSILENDQYSQMVVWKITTYV
jgi:hypothetical protein